MWTTETGVAGRQSGNHAATGPMAASRSARRATGAVRHHAAVRDAGHEDPRRVDREAARDVVEQRAQELDVARARGRPSGVRAPAGTRPRSARDRRAGPSGTRRSTSRGGCARAVQHDDERHRRQPSPSTAAACARGTCGVGRRPRAGRPSSRDVVVATALPAAARPKRMLRSQGGRRVARAPARSAGRHPPARNQSTVARSASRQRRSGRRRGTAPAAGSESACECSHVADAALPCARSRAACRGSPRASAIERRAARCGSRTRGSPASGSSRRRAMASAITLGDGADVGEVAALLARRRAP